MIRVLLVEDDPFVSDVLLYYLQQEGTYEVVCAKTAGEAFAKARDHFDVILLDILLPDANGIALCEELRKWHDCPIIFISCLDDSDTIVKALSSGGDAFIAKPFDNKVLNACIEANLRRYNSQPTQHPSNVVESNGLVLDADKHTVRKGEDEIRLSDTEFRLLLFLMTNIGKYFTPKELYRHVWDSSGAGDSKTVLVHIYNLRHKLEDDPANPRYIVMEWGKGYTFSGEEPAK